MKYAVLSVVFTTYMVMAWGQVKVSAENVLISTDNKPTSVSIGEKKELQVNVSPSDLQKFIKRGWVLYSDFGAKGDGKIDDIDNIAGTHAVANQYGLSVKANEGATYYISGKERTAIIRTNTDFGTAAFIIDDTEVEKNTASVFMVGSGLQPIKIANIASLKRNQQKIDQSLPSVCLITVTNSKVKRFIRFGLNQNNGASQTDIFLVDKNGNVDMNAPIVWDFNQITDITALPIDETTLSITGGRFTTIANKVESKYSYYNRNIAIRRSHVLVKGLEHHITGEGEHGAPYGGFINIGDCAFVTIRNTLLSGHKTYETIGAAGKPVSMGTYDISVNRALNVSFVNCKQTNDINNKTYWGIMGSNFSKNLLYDSCIFSRFDAHMGVANATIRNSSQHDFGYTCYMPERITIENLLIKDSNHPNAYQGPAIFANFNPDLKDSSYQEPFPFVRTKEVILKNVTTSSGTKLRMSDNPFLFKDVKLVIK